MADEICARLDARQPSFLPTCTTDVSLPTGLVCGNELGFRDKHQLDSQNNTRDPPEVNNTSILKPTKSISDAGGNCRRELDITSTSESISTKGSKQHGKAKTLDDDLADYHFDGFPHDYE
jgi:hypothetical protein